MCQDDDDGLAAADVVGATPAAPRDDGDDGGDDDVDGDARSRRRLARAVAADDDEDDATPSPGHPPVLRLPGRAPLTRCSYSRSLSTTNSFDQKLEASTRILVQNLYFRKRDEKERPGVKY